jgi:thiamine-phosphate pyrophosphorylase
VSLAPPIFCLVTSRHRLAARIGWVADGTNIEDALVAQAAAAASAGVRLVQLREPDLPARRQVDLGRAMQNAVTPHGALVVINERLDVALAAGVAGVHLKATSIATADARALAGPRRLIGRSVHGLADLAGQEDADYLVFGAVFATPSKPQDRQPAGLHRLAALVTAAGATPVIAIGGITAATAGGAAASGAAGVAAIGAFLPDAGCDLDEGVRAAVLRVRSGFDSPMPLSYHGPNA